MSEAKEPTNQDLIERFEADAIPDNVFHHADHVRLAFAYLSQYPVLQALEKFATALKRFAHARGKPQLYNETITCAYFFLIRERMVRTKKVRSQKVRSQKVQSKKVRGEEAQPTDSDRDGIEWEEFSRRNSDLLVWKNGVLSRYYDEATLKSDLARTVFLLPDKRI